MQKGIGYLVGKANASTQADAANDEHGQILGKGTQDGTSAEGGTSTDHHQLPASELGNRVAEESKESTCRVSTAVRCVCT